MGIKRWLMFLGWQLAGSLAAMSAHPVDRVSWGIYVTTLLPGSLATRWLFEGGDPEYYLPGWPKWGPYAIVAGINIVVFMATDVALRVRRARISKQ